MTALKEINVLVATKKNAAIKDSAASDTDYYTDTFVSILAPCAAPTVCGARTHDEENKRPGTGTKGGLMNNAITRSTAFARNGSQRGKGHACEAHLSTAGRECEMGRPAESRSEISLDVEQYKAGSCRRLFGDHGRD